MKRTLAVKLYHQLLGIGIGRFLEWLPPNTIPENSGARWSGPPQNERPEGSHSGLIPTLARNTKRVKKREVRNCHRNLSPLWHGTLGCCSQLVGHVLGMFTLLMLKNTGNVSCVTKSYYLSVCIHGMATDPFKITSQYRKNWGFIRMKIHLLEWIKSQIKLYLLHAPCITLNHTENIKAIQKCS